MTRQRHTEGFKAGMDLVHILGALAVTAIVFGIPIVALIKSLT